MSPDTLAHYYNGSGVRLRNLAQSLTRNGPEADELFQATMVKVLRHSRRVKTGPGAGDLDGFMSRVMVNAHKDEARSRALGKPGKGNGRAALVSLDWRGEDGGSAALRDLLVGPDLDPAQVALTAWEAQARRVKVQRVLGLMSEDRARLLLLVYGEGARYEDAARAFRVPLGTVRSRLSRAREDFVLLWRRGRGRPARGHA